MRPALRWVLLLTLGLSALALWWPERGSPGLVRAIQRSPSIEESPPVSPAQSRAAPGLPLPTTIPPLRVAPAQRDIFAAALATAGPTGAAVRAAAASVQPAPAPPMPTPAALPSPPAASPAPAPALRVRYLGSMLTPMGEHLILLARGDDAFIARVGLKVEGGYAVQSVDPAAVRIVHEASGAAIDIPIPAAPALSSVPAPAPPASAAR